MATIKLAPAPVFAINRYGEVVGNDHAGRRIVLECKSRLLELNGHDLPTLKQLVDGIAELENVENVYVLSVENGLGHIKIRYAVHEGY